MTTRTRNTTVQSYCIGYRWCHREQHFGMHLSRIWKMRMMVATTTTTTTTTTPSLGRYRRRIMSGDKTMRRRRRSSKEK